MSEGVYRANVGATAHGPPLEERVKWLLPSKAPAIAWMGTRIAGGHGGGAQHTQHVRLPCRAAQRELAVDKEHRDGMDPRGVHIVDVAEDRGGLLVAAQKTLGLGGVGACRRGCRDERVDIIEQAALDKMDRMEVRVGDFGSLPAVCVVEPPNQPVRT